MLKAVGRTGYPVLVFSLLCRPTSRLLRTEPFWQCLLCQSSIAMGPVSNPVSSSPRTHGNRHMQPSSQVVSRSSRPQGPRRPRTWLQRLSQQQHQQPSPSPQRLSEHPLQQQPHEPIVCKEQQQQQFANPYAQARQQRARMLSHTSHSRQQTHSQPQQQQVQARSSSSSNSSTTATAKVEAASVDRPASARQQYSSPYVELAAARQALRRQQQQRANAAAAAPRPTSSSAFASPTAAPSSKQLQQHRPPQARSYSRGGILPVIAASVSDSYAAKAAGAAFPYRCRSSRTTSTLTPQQASKHSRRSQASASAGQEQHEQQQQLLWHDFRDSSSRSRSLGGRQQQHPQQGLPPELQQLPANSGPVSIDITHLLSLQAEADGEDTSSSSSSSKRQSKFSMLQRQLRALQSQYGQQQQLLWVTVHQLQGPAGPAAVWVKPWAAAFDVEQLRVVAGPGGKDTVLCELQERPDLGQQPMAVVEGLRFLPSPCSTGSSSSGSDGSNGGDGSGSSGSSSAGCVYDCLVLSSGDFSPLEHENMFPNAMVHCGDGRQMHSARVSGRVLVT